MTDNNVPGRIVNLNHKNFYQGPMRSSSPATAANQFLVSTRHPYTTDHARRTSVPSTVGGTLSNSRAQHTSHGHSTIQMEPGLQALLVAEGRAAATIVAARTKRNELLRQSNRESQIEIEAFRREREAQYKKKFNEATKLEQFQTKLDKQRHELLEKMNVDAQKNRKSLINHIIHCVIDQIPVEPHPNMKHSIF
ncbi:unnamed protein product [Rotaria socialis]|uniref:V-type proton ATPase subunit G n=1 Tax=Rotaria socialis TaxID=392032 RepID=A0A817SM53_9BILA|nr:unnamed protein product [Rotaria socialis]